MVMIVFKVFLELFLHTHNRVHIKRQWKKDKKKINKGGRETSESNLGTIMQLLLAMKLGT
jgi:mRNA-degrading endonuclease YafQ of YafQ-DinJ toxin-antitoxin module